MKKYPKTIGRQCVQRRIEVKNENVEECKQHYLKQNCTILDEENSYNEGTTYIDIMYHE